MGRRGVIALCALGGALAVGGLVLTSGSDGQNSDDSGPGARASESDVVQERLDPGTGAADDEVAAVAWIPVDAETRLIYRGSGPPLGEFERVITRTESRDDGSITVESNDTFENGLAPESAVLSFVLREDGTLEIPLEAFFVGADRPSIVGDTTIVLDPADPLADGPIERDLEIELGPENFRQRGAAHLGVTRLEDEEIEVPAGSFTTAAVAVALDVDLPSGTLGLRGMVWLDADMGVVRQTIGESPQQVVIELQEVALAPAESE